MGIWRASDAAYSRQQLPTAWPAFTLPELLVVIGIISVLMSLLLPAMAGVRSQARAVQCESNVRSIVTALTLYATFNKGHYPPNQNSPAPGNLWYDADRIGQILTPNSPGAGGFVGGVAVCPEDEGGKRSYGMNTWASSGVDSTVRKTIPARGVLWSSNCLNASKMILVAEQWGAYGSWSGGWVTGEPFGWGGLTPGARFGGKGGLTPLMIPALMLFANSELPFARHRSRNGVGVGTQPRGRINIGYADGHVELKSDTDLLKPDGTSTLDSLWSPMDVNINY